MNRDEQKRKGKLAICSSVGELGLGAFMLMLSAIGKDSWEYYLSSSYRSSADLIGILGWLGIIAGVAQLIYGIIVVSSADEEQSESENAEKKEENVVSIEGEFVNKEWDPEHHQVEWITVRQRNGLTIRMWHYLADDIVYKTGQRGKFCVKDRLITEFVSSESVQQEIQ